MIKDKNRIYDGFDSVEAGVDAGRRSTVIGKNQVYSAENVSFRGGIPKTRPGFASITHIYTNPNSSYTAAGLLSETLVTGQTAQLVFETGVFQCACYYSPRGGKECVMAMIGGRLFRLDPDYNTYSIRITEVRMPYRNRKNITRAFIIQADKFIIIQDGESLPIIYDGASARRAADDEVVPGTIMAYGMGRLIVIRGQDIYFGDLYGSHDLEDPGDSVIKFTETTYLNEGFPASIPFALGKTTGVAFFPQQDTATGMGEVMVFAEHGAASFALRLPRDEWKNSRFQKMALLNTGLRGWRSIVSVNEDLWFRAEDGVRSFRQAQSEINGWAHLPASTNVHQYLENDTTQLLDLASSVHFENQVIMTCTPIWNKGRPYHNGFVVIDFDILSSFGSANQPAWNGHWSNLRTTQLVQGTFNSTKRAFAFAINNNNVNHIYEITVDGTDDYNGKIACEIVSRAFDFAQDQVANPFTEKEIYGADIWLNGILDEDFVLTFSYKPDDYPEWVPWKTLAAFDPIGTCGAITCGGCPTIRQGFHPRVTIPKPANACDPNTQRNLRRGFEFQTRLQWSGKAAIQRLRVHAQQLVENSRSGC